MRLLPWAALRSDSEQLHYYSGKFKLESGLTNEDFSDPKSEIFKEISMPES